MRRGVFGLLAMAFAIGGTPVSAQVRDAVYRGTMVCDKFPFTVGNGREAVEVHCRKRGACTHAVRLRCGSPDRRQVPAQRQKHRPKDHGRVVTANTRQNTAGRSSGVTPASKALKSGATAAKPSAGPVLAQLNGL